MRTSLALRPLLPAGLAAMGGVALAGAPPCWTALLLAGLLGWAAFRRVALPVLAAAALLAGYASGAGERARVDAGLLAQAAAWPRAPPLAAQTRLIVTRCGENPFRGRAWLEGRPSTGPGVICSFDGSLPDGVGPGAHVRVTGRFRALDPPGNPGERDQRVAFAARGVAWRCDLRTAANVEVFRPAPRTVHGFLAALRRRAAARLCADLPADVAPLAVAFLVGDRSGLADEDRLLFERTGTMHLLAISGLHVLLLAGMVHAILRALGLGPRGAAAVTLALALGYVPVAGAGAPVRRAVSMLTFYALALVRGRPPDGASALGGAALLLALTDPADALGVGARLSFAAAAGILWLAGAWRDRWSERHRLLRRFPAVQQDRPIRLRAASYALSAFPIALAAWISTQALVAREFGVLTPLAPLVNLLVAPLVPVLLAAVTLAALALPGAATAVTWLVHALRWVLGHAARLPGTFWVVPSPPVAAVLAWGAGCVLLRRGPRRALPCFALAVGLSAAAWPTPPTDPELVMLDVGHGQALLLRFTDGSSVLVDGGSRSRLDVGRRSVLPALRAIGVTHLDVIVVTHPDSDHWNALPLLLGRFPVGQLVTGEDVTPALARAAAAAGVPRVTARDGAVVRAGPRARLEVLSAGAHVRSDNDASLVLLLECDGRRVLLPADREEIGLRLLQADGLPPCDVLVAPHHGARCDEAGPLGRTVRPALLLVSSSQEFADPETLARYGAPEVLHTAKRGAVTLRFPRSAAPVATAFRDGARATIRGP